MFVLPQCARCELWKIFYVVWYELYLYIMTMNIFVNCIELNIINDSLPSPHTAVSIPHQGLDRKAHLHSRGSPWKYPYYRYYGAILIVCGGVGSFHHTFSFAPIHWQLEILPRPAGCCITHTLYTNHNKIVYRQCLNEHGTIASRWTNNQPC